MTNDPNAWNRQIIAEFRENAGKVGGQFEGMPMLLLHTTGAKSGAARINPLAFQAIGDTWAVFASKAGATSNPDWYYNVVANPDLEIEVGTETVPARARVATSDERDRIWNTQKETIPQFAEYEKTAGSRTIPVIVIERR
ncbi:MAG: nitroreductase family deazaflavin-dependent oxidoreductase [Chloroflexi bacterium]|nr:nitroreductase family deazaflavin-dependent oxidoreductase [Chloroflexota bacterium]MDA1148109.1 nitroreductase family deazaflavin-dependent oxidoreductase [Chloroflexota bacterium]MQC82337.1 nitroreductase family deazaflavin-dependent oxidoreductase [Chloroflexota bacterium]